MSEVRGVTIGHECPGKSKWVDPKDPGGTVANFRKKPVVIQAVLAVSGGEIETLEGVMRYEEGDFIITGVKGERYPCKPDIFRETYEAVDFDAATLLRISEQKDRAEQFYEDFPRSQELKVDPLAEEFECEFCPAREKVYPWAVPQTTTTLMLCRKCWQERAGMTVEEMWPLNEKSEKEG